MASKLRLQIAPDKCPATWNPEKTLTDALAERALFLESHPEYNAFQKQIDRMLDKAGSPENRMAVLSVLMESKLVELQEELRQLNSILIGMTDQERPQMQVNRLTSFK
jgi:hypothetical protein